MLAIKYNMAHLLCQVLAAGRCADCVALCIGAALHQDLALLYPPLLSSHAFSLCLFDAEECNAKLQFVRGRSYRSSR